MAYIYQIINDINNKIYIGKTEHSIEKRFKQHCRDAFRPSIEKRPLYSAMRKYGIENFHIELIEETDNPEEREIYWIEQKQSFKYGYNATKGGDGKRYLDYDLILATYQEIQSCNKTAEKLNISVDSVISVLKNNSIKIKTPQEIAKEQYNKKVAMYDKGNGELIKIFSSISNAARYLQENNISSCKTIRGIIAHIGQVCSGKRKSAYKYKWKFL